jgi:RNA polymerase sigma factor (sigma-70 family)
MTALEADTDAALLERVANRARSAAEARAAEAIFYRRHVRFLYGVLHKRKGQLLAGAGLTAEDLVQETFMRTFERAHTFSEAPADRGAEYATARTRAWLGSVATRLLADHMNRLREVSATPYIERLTAPAIDEAPLAESTAVALVSEGLELLTERERDILQVTALYKRAGEEHGRLPNAVAQDLSKRWDTSNDNIRAIRVRAMKKLKEFLFSRGADAKGGTT